VCGRNKESTKVRTEEGEEDEHVPPSVRKLNVQGQEELIPDFELAIPASSGIVEIIDIATKSLHEILTPRHASLSCRRVEGRIFVRLATDGQTTSNEVSDLQR
jgi:hypothetical protein